MTTGEGLLLRVSGDSDPAIRELDRLDRSIAKTQKLIAAENAKMAADAEDAARRQSQASATIGRGLAVVALAVGAAAAATVTSWASYDQTISHVSASSEDAKAHIVELGDAAVDAGAKTVFTANEAAAAEENLAKAGLSAADILGGALDGALDLAAAGSLEVADAASITAGALTQYSLAGSDAVHVSDLLASGATKAQGDVSDLGLALTYVGTPLAALGVSIEDTTGTLALLADNMIIGERAGTSLRGMIASITSPSALAAKEMQKLGISVFDAQGNFIGLDGVAGELNRTLGDATDAERSLALGRIFGNEQLQAANVLTDAGAQGVRDWTASVNDGTTAAGIAAERLDNLAGDYEKLKGAISSALIETGEQGNDVLRDTVQSATAVIDIYNGMGDGAKTVALGTLALTTAVSLAGAAYFLAAPKVAAFKAAVATTDSAGAVTGMTKLGSATMLVGKSMGVLGLALIPASLLLAGYAKKQADARAAAESFADSLDDVTGALTDQSSKLLAAGIQKQAADYDALDMSLGDLTATVAAGGEAYEALIANLGAIHEAGKEGVPTIHGYVEAEEGRAASAERLRLALIAQRKVVEDGIAINDAAAEADKVAAEAAEGHGGALDHLGNKMGEVVQTAPELTEAEELLADRFNIGADAAHSLADAMAEAKRQQDILTGANVGSIESQIAFNQALADADETIQKVAEAAGDMGKIIDPATGFISTTTEAGWELNESFIAIRDRSLEAADAAFNLTGKDADYRAEVDRGRQALFDKASQYFDTEQAAWDYVDAILAIPEERVTTAGWEDAEARRLAGEFGSYVDWVTRNRTIRVGFDYSGTTTPGPLEGGAGDGGRYAGGGSDQRGFGSQSFGEQGAAVGTRSWSASDWRTGGAPPIMVNAGYDGPPIVNHQHFGPGTPPSVGISAVSALGALVGAM